MAQGKRGRPMTAVDVKLAKLLSDVAYIQAQVQKDERVTVDQRTALDTALLNIGAAITQAQAVFPAAAAVSTNVEQLNAVVETEAAPATIRVLVAA